MSGNDTGSVMLSAVPLAKALVVRGKGENPLRAATPVKDKAAVTARRVMIKIGSRIGALARRPATMLAALCSIGND